MQGCKWQKKLFAAFCCLMDTKEFRVFKVFGDFRDGWETHFCQNDVNFGVFLLANCQNLKKIKLFAIFFEYFLAFCLQIKKLYVILPA
ncbi:MAG: hypothetical protein ACI31F_01930 [Muribaculaceae bacterium]